MHKPVCPIKIKAQQPNSLLQPISNAARTDYPIMPLPSDDKEDKRPITAAATKHRRTAKRISWQPVLDALVFIDQDMQATVDRDDTSSFLELKGKHRRTAQHTSWRQVLDALAFTFDEMEAIVDRDESFQELERGFVKQGMCHQHVPATYCPSFEVSPLGTSSPKMNACSTPAC